VIATAADKAYRGLRKNGIILSDNDHGQIYQKLAGMSREMSGSKILPFWWRRRVVISVDDASAIANSPDNVAAAQSHAGFGYQPAGAAAQWQRPISQRMKPHRILPISSKNERTAE
jgi:hypothetical protein